MITPGKSAPGLGRPCAEATPSSLFLFGLDAVRDTFAQAATAQAGEFSRVLLRDEGQ